ncbi:MAG: M20/M25/M40 family metallo-hydrolase, partial [Oscillospiraceae bacterium]|nr:M20/M25/M40 family metallo-hydrolase [Oscillospiraceae bacterium]
REGEEIVALGDRVTVDSAFRELCGGIVSAPAIDDRSGVCAILAALDMLKDKDLAYDLAVCFSAQEETGERGAKQAAFRIQPDECIAVDVSFGQTPDSDPKDTAKLGSGVMIGFSAALNKGMSINLRELAKRENIPYTIEVMPDSTGTNADAVGISGKGVKCCTLSFPIRYMHTPVECVDIKDIESTARLICEYALGGADNDR